MPTNTLDCQHTVADLAMALFPMNDEFVCDIHHSDHDREASMRNVHVVAPINSRLGLHMLGMVGHGYCLEWDDDGACLVRDAS